DIVLTASEVSSLLLVPTLITLFTPQSGRWPALMALIVGAMSLFGLHWIMAVPGGYLLTLALGALAYGLTVLVLRLSR
ncbi:MAG: hypothetical protein AAF511_06965, partial [Pseudomonadota bacterium]